MIKKTPAELSVMKSLAFLAVVFQSALLYVMNHRSPHAEEAIMISILFQVVKFSAPVFVFLVGFHIAQQTDAIHYSRYMSHKWRELIVPYITWSFIYLILFSSHSHAFEAVKQLLLGETAPHLWYVVMIIQFHLLIVAIVPFFRWLNEKKYWKLFIIVSAITYMGFITFISPIVQSKSYIHYVDRTFLAYFFYFCLGSMAAYTLPSWRKFVIRAIPLNTFLFLSLFIFVGYELFISQGVFSIDLSAITYLKPSMVLYVTSEIVLLYGLSITIVQTKSRLYTTLRFVSRYTYGAYIGHVFFLYMFAPTIPTTIYSLLQAVILFTITTVSSVGICYMIHATPFSLLFIGQAREHRTLSIPTISKLKKGIPS
ncbi:surface polysaccharide O-acyltransferase-like enzyme [Anoxybacillus kamchatkensis]|uniref:acyltransferase n=1 Tax=Anoxybacillus ayderensis TaxID=265546 RepID=UPI0015EB40B5|nr:acyltransferase [Anoxybacillus ayderensis]MBA2877982.1 surface polysaccharide O-acyltransferase-like enzyme [Anoxybacillus ayderensis]